jgi:hypothetical protein
MTTIPDFPDGCSQCFALGGGRIAEGLIVDFVAPAHAPDCIAAGVPF